MGIIEKLILFWGFGGAILICLISNPTVKWAKYLKETYPDVWVKIGCSESLYSQTWDDRKKLNSFFKNKEYLPLNDPELTRLIILNRRLVFLTNLFAVILIILFVLHFSKTLSVNQ
jgi:hypothetical protein